jgi:hypothetical protein
VTAPANLALQQTGLSLAYGSLWRPQLNAGTLGRLHRVSGFLSVPRSRSRSICAWARRAACSDYPDQTASNVLPAAAPPHHRVSPPLVSRTRQRHLHRQRSRETAGCLLNLFLSPVVNYHGLGRDTGFGDIRPCNTLASFTAATTAPPARDTTAPSPASFPSSRPDPS